MGQVRAIGQAAPWESLFLRGRGPAPNLPASTPRFPAGSRERGEDGWGAVLLQQATVQGGDREGQWPRNTSLGEAEASGSADPT